ncbi:Sodium-dependent phosphate transporter, partial [Operophtera brumata]
MLLAFTMRVNMSMAIVDMTDERKDKYFDWSHSIQSVILSSFFWGYVMLQIPAGELARRFGGKSLILISIGVNSLGLTQAFIYPSMHHLVSQWIPLQEKGLLTTIIYAGENRFTFLRRHLFSTLVSFSSGQLGIALQMLLSGFLATAWGWEAIFYTNGTLGVIWSVAYLILGSDSPETSKLISAEEVQYIQTSLGRIGEQKIMTSLPFWAVIVAHCGQNWGFFTLMTEMPTYMSKVLNVDLKSNGMLSSLPYLSMYILSFPMGAMTDIIIRKSWLSVTNTRKLFNTIGLWGPAIALIGLSYSPAGNMAFAVGMLTISVGINAGQYLGYMLVHIDLAPNFSASLMGITNFLANIISIIAPLTEPAEWRKVFFVASGVYFFTNLFFVLFCTSERQPNENRYEVRTIGCQKIA